MSSSPQVDLTPLTPLSASGEGGKGGEVYPQRASRAAAQARGNSQPSLLRWIPAGALAGGLALFQGGVFTDMLFRSAGGESLRQAFSWNWPPTVYFGNLVPVVPFQTAFWESYYILVFGLPLLAAPLAVGWLLWHGGPLGIPLATIGILGIVIPHVVEYTYSPDLGRFLGYGSMALALGLGMALVWLARRHWLLVPVLLLSLLSFAVPLRIAAAHIFEERHATLGWSWEARLSLSPVFRTQDQLDNYDYLAGHAREAVLPDSLILAMRAEFTKASRVLTDQPMEVALATGVYAPHAPLDAISYMLGHNPGPEYIDALFSLSPRAMQRLGATHVVMSNWWFGKLPPVLQQRLQNEAWFKLVYSTESEAGQHGGHWHRIYRVSPDYFSQPELTVTLADLVTQIPEGASVYVSPAIPNELRWAVVYALRTRRIFTTDLAYHHTTATVRVERPRFGMQYDFAVLNSQSDSTRWRTWEFARQDTPAAWGFAPEEAIWQNYGLSVVAMPVAAAPSRLAADHDHFVSVGPGAPFVATLQPERTLTGPLAVRVRLFTTQPATVQLRYGESEEELELAPGLTTLVSDAVIAPVPVEVEVRQGGPVEVAVALVPATGAFVRLGVPAVRLEPRVEEGHIVVDLDYVNPDTKGVGLEAAWLINRAGFVYGEEWRWTSKTLVGAWISHLQVDASAAKARFVLASDLKHAEEEINGETVSLPAAWPPETSPGRPYVLYFNILIPGQGRQTALPLITFLPSDEGLSNVTLYPRIVELGL